MKGYLHLLLQVWPLLIAHQLYIFSYEIDLLIEMPFRSTFTTTRAPSSRPWARPSSGSPPENQAVRKKLLSPTPSCVQKSCHCHLFLCLVFTLILSCLSKLHFHKNLRTWISYIWSKIWRQGETEPRYWRDWARLEFWITDGHTCVSCLATSSDKTEL